MDKEGIYNLMTDNIKLDRQFMKQKLRINNEMNLKVKSPEFFSAGSKKLYEDYINKGGLIDTEIKEFTGKLNSLAKRINIYDLILLLKCVFGTDKKYALKCVKYLNRKIRVKILGGW